MELKEYLRIIQKNAYLFLAVISLTIAAGLLFFFVLRPVSYESSLTLNISRAGSQETSEYKYDDFYRLQADEKFAETIVQWLRSPRVISDIYLAAGVSAEKLTLRQMKKAIRGEKLSSQIVAVSFSSSDMEKAKALSRAVAEVVSKNTDNLNKNQKEGTWFQIIPQDPVIKKYSPGIWLSLFAPLLLGIFLGFWIILVKHYLE